jgi:hypothetical protein
LQTTGLTAITDEVGHDLAGAATPPSNIYASYKSMVLYEAIKTAADTGELVEVTYKP